MISVYKRKIFKQENRRFIKQELLFVHDGIDSAFHAADTYIVDQIGHFRSLQLTPYAKWRKEPATKSQINLLNKWKLGWKYINRGEASDLLMKRMNGSLKAQKERDKVQKKASKTVFF